MKIKTRLFIFILAAALFAVAPLTVNADTGPKPSVTVNFENMTDELCYATLLSNKPHSGPWSSWNGEDDNMDYDMGLMTEDDWRAFATYDDPDGYCFLQGAVWKVSETKTLCWSYYPPDSFKVLLYYPDAGVFEVTGICERYAFDTYYTVNMEGRGIGSADYNEQLSSDRKLVAERSYDWGREIISLLVRIAVTIAVEMLVALLFGFRGKKAFLFLLIVNVATQVLMNVLLNIIGFGYGDAAFVVAYVLIELQVFAIEAVLYSVLMNRFTEKKRKVPFHILYAFVANAASFAAGLALAKVFEEFF